jgi:sec-independent protein translocase protein TatA
MVVVAAIKEEVTMSTTPLFVQNLRPIEIIIILLIILLLFGSKKLPDLARGVGRSLRIFRAETKELRDESASAAADDEPVAEAHEIHEVEAKPKQTEPVHNPTSESVTDQSRRDA